MDWIGDQAINVVYRDHHGSVEESVIYRDDEHRIEFGRLDVAPDAAAVNNRTVLDMKNYWKQIFPGN